MADDDLSDDAINDAISQLPNSRGIATTNVDQNPDDAAKAINLGQISGLPAAVIHADLDNYTTRLKAIAAGQLVSGNPQLAQYAASDPMAAKVSSDDWDKLDAVSQSVAKVSQPSILGAAAQGFSEGWDWQGQQETARQMLTAVDSPAWRLFVQGVLGPASSVFSVPTHLFSGAIQAGIAGVAQAGSNLFGEDPEETKRNLNVLATMLPMEHLGAVAGPERTIAKMNRTMDELTIHPQHIQEANDLGGKVKPYLEDGKPPPVGVHPLIDQLKAAEANADVDSLKQATKDAQASATRERAPTMFRDFMSQHTRDQTVGVSAETALKLYGGKVPGPDDGIFGFVPDIHDQLLRAATTGDDVRIPLADWFTYVDPKLASDLMPNVRIREGGLTQEEAKALPKPEVAPEPDQVDIQAIKQEHTDSQGRLNGGEFSNHIANVVQEALAQGKQVAYTIEGKEVPIVSVDRGMMQDAKGQRWGNMSLMNGEGGLRISGARSPDPTTQAVETVRQAAGLDVKAPGLDLPEAAAQPASSSVQAALNKDKEGVPHYKGLVNADGSPSGDPVAAAAYTSRRLTERGLKVGDRVYYRGVGGKVESGVIREGSGTDSAGNSSVDILGDDGVYTNIHVDHLIREDELPRNSAGRKVTDVLNEINSSGLNLPEQAPRLTPAVKVNDKVYSVPDPEMGHVEATELARKEHSDEDVDKALEGDGIGYLYKGKFYNYGNKDEDFHLDESQREFEEAKKAPQPPDTLGQFKSVNNSDKYKRYTYQDGKGQLNFIIEPDAVHIQDIQLSKELQGKGLAISAYKDLADWALSTGKFLVSDGSVSPAAGKLYDALEKRGYTVERTLRPQPDRPDAEPQYTYKVTAKPESASAKKPPTPTMEVEAYDNRVKITPEGASKQKREGLELIIENNKLEVLGAFLPDDLKGKGVGIAMYEKAIEIAQQQGKILYSSGPSAKAVNVWEALRRRGYNIEKAPDLTQQQSGKFHSPSQDWAYRFVPKEPAAEDPSILTKLGDKPNAYIDVPEGKIYLRQRPGQLDIANILFDEDKRGTGAFTRYLAEIEAEAKDKGFKTIKVENVENPRLGPFLERQGYIKSENSGGLWSYEKKFPGQEEVANDEISSKIDSIQKEYDATREELRKAVATGGMSRKAYTTRDALRDKIKELSKQLLEETNKQAESKRDTSLKQFKKELDETTHKIIEGVAKHSAHLGEDPNYRDRPIESDTKTAAVEEPKLFQKPSAIGETQARYRRFQELIAKQQAEDHEAALSRAQAFEKRQQTAEWKANRDVMRQEVENEIVQQSRFVADKALREFKLDTQALTEEQKAGLSKSFYRNGGESPDYVARVLGYASGDDMIKDLTALQQERGQMRPDAYLNQLINRETDRRMAEKYGKLEDNVLQSAKEQVLSTTQLDLLHAELEHLSGGNLPLTREALQKSVAEKIGAMKLGNISSDSMLAASGRAGRALEDALLKGDAAEALRQAQLRYASTLYAKEAMKVEKAKAQFDKLTKQFSKREVPGALQEYTNQIHQLMINLGLGVRRSVQDIAENIAKDGYSSFDAFVAAKEGAFRELYVPDFLRDANFRSKVDDLTGEQFAQVARAFKALAFNAKDEGKIIRAGEKADLVDTINDMIEKLKTLGPAKAYKLDRPAGIINTLKSFGWSMVQMETMFNRFDRDDPLGVFNQTLVRTYTEAANYKDRVIKQYQEKLNALGRIPDMNKLVKNDLFKDPRTGVAFPMRKRNVLGILANIGNESNLRKLAEGYGLTPEVVKQWVEANTTKEDWDRAQKIGEHFNDLFDMADNMSHIVSGVGIEKIPLTPLESKFGTYKGWYNPVSYDSRFPGTSPKLLGPDALERDGYYRATTPQGYAKARTGYIAPVELNLDIIPQRMRQMIHDITMRPAIIQLSKFFYDSRFQNAVIGYYGDHQAKMMIPFLRDIANTANFRSQFEGTFNDFLNAASQNMVGTMIGLNPSTVMKHGPTALVNSLSQVGLIPWAREFTSLMKSDPATANSNWSMAMSKSNELARRMRNFQEVISNSGQDLTLHDSGSKSLFKDVRAFAQYLGSFPVSASDLLSAVPTWLAEYKKQIAEGSDEGLAQILADRAVRQAHGSSIITNKPAIARSSNAIASTFSRLYGFFSHILQKQYEIGWRMKDAYGLAQEGNIEDAAKSVPKIAGMITSYVLAPLLIEELVTPYTNSDHDSWGIKAAKTLGLGMSSSMIGVRDFMYALINNRDPQGGILGGEMKAFSDPIKDLASGKAFTPAKTANFLKHLAVMVGVATGITNAQEGKSAQFIYNYFNNREHPKNTWQALEGLRYGKTKGHSKSFDDWLAGK